MYNFLIAGLQIGCTLFLYDGSPLKDPSLLWKWVDEFKISIFGTSAKYLDQLSVRLSFSTLIRRSSTECSESTSQDTTIADSPSINIESA